MQKRKIKQRAKRTKPITSADEIEVEVIYAEPSEEAEKLLDEVVRRIWEYGKTRRGG